MPRYAFVLSEEDHLFLKNTARKNRKSQSELVREGLIYLRGRYETEFGCYVMAESIKAGIKEEKKEAKGVEL